MKSLYLRPTHSEDYPRIVEIYNMREGDSLPLTVARYREECEAEREEPTNARMVAIRDGQVLGFGRYHPAWWTGQPHIYAMEIYADPHHSHQGVGTRLWDGMRSDLIQRGAARLLAWIRADAGKAHAFATRSGFVETGQVIQEYRLPIAEADTRAHTELRARLAGEGVRVASLENWGRTDEAFLRALQHLWAEAGEEAPDPNQLRNSFDSWQQQVLHGPGQAPDTHWIALEGERPVGMTFLKRLSEDAFENDYTCVAPGFRSRGIATALKLSAIRWAQNQGAQWFYTSSEVSNQAMISINTRLGYRPGAQRREVARDLS